MTSNLIRWRPYWGTAKNADTLSESLTEKAKIVEEVTGVKLALVQGAPSGSSKSGGTHLGHGNAADFGLVTYPHGMTETAAYLAVSLAFRTLHCFGWVRGKDVDSNGVKDDSFDPHLHVIDRESVLTSAQAGQLADYLAGRNGLVGGRKDLEPRPPRTFTLAEWRAQEGDLTVSQYNDIMSAIDALDKKLTAAIGETQSRIGPKGTTLYAQVNNVAAEIQRRIGPKGTTLHTEIQELKRGDAR